jgi:hypothetical protein
MKGGGGMRLRKTLLIAGTLFVILVISNQTSRGEDWTFLDENEAGVHFYDQASITKTSQGNLLVRISQFPVPDLIETLEELLPNTKGFSYMVSEDEIDCQHRVYKIRRIIYLNKNNQIIHDSAKEEKKYRPMDFRPIPKGTVIYRLTDIICP